MAAKYNAWKGDARYEPTPKLERVCHHVSPGGKSCVWRGERIDMHLKRSHKLKPSDDKYANLLSKSKTRRQSSTTTSTTTTTVSTSSRRRTSIASASPSSDAPLVELLARPLPAKRRIIQSSDSEEEVTCKKKKMKISNKYFTDVESSDEEPPAKTTSITYEIKDKQDSEVQAEEDKGEDTGADSSEDSSEEDYDEEKDVEDFEEDDELDEEEEEECITDEVEHKKDGRGEFGEGCHPNNTIEVFLKGFNHHLSTPDGGCKDNSQIRQHCSQVRCQESRCCSVKETSYNMLSFLIGESCVRCPWPAQQRQGVL